MTQPTKAEMAAWERKRIVKARNRRRRQAQRAHQRARVAAAPIVVVQLPTLRLDGVAGQHQGRILQGERHSPELRAAMERLAVERAKEATSHA